MLVEVTGGDDVDMMLTEQQKNNKNKNTQHGKYEVLDKFICTQQRVNFRH